MGRFDNVQSTLDQEDNRYYANKKAEGMKSEEVRCVSPFKITLLTGFKISTS